MVTSSVSNVLLVLGVVALVLVNGFFVAAEFALISIRRTRVEELIQQGRTDAKVVKKALEDPDRFIAATQLGVTIASLGVGWLGEPALTRYIQPVLDLLPPAWIGLASHSISAVFAFVVITFLHVVVGELTPKSIALQKTEQTALFVARPTLLAEMIFKPAIWALNGAGNGLLRLMGLLPAGQHPQAHSVEELKMLVEASEAVGVIEDVERDMLHAVFDFGDLTAHEVMVPRTEIVAIDADATLAELVELSSQHPLSKFPVYEGDLDHVLGIAHVKDLVRVPPDAGRTAAVRSLVRDVLFVPATLQLDALLQQFRTKHQHLAIVLDEYGGTAGLVTLDDLMEELVGEVSDTFDQAAPAIQPRPDGSALVDGLTHIEDVNEHFGLNLHDDYYDTIAGLVMGRLGRPPKVGDCVAVEGVDLKVEALDGRRISQLSVFPHAPADNTSAEPAAPPAA